MLKQLLLKDYDSEKKSAVTVLLAQLSLQQALKILQLCFQMNSNFCSLKVSQQGLFSSAVPLVVRTCRCGVGGELTECHGVEHSGVGRSSDALVDDAEAVLHGALGHVHVQPHDEEGHEEAVDQVLREPHQDAHPIPGQVPARPPAHGEIIRDPGYK